jgi:putative membrane protein
MVQFVLRVVVNALALWVATWLLPGMDITSSATAEAAAGAGAGGASAAVGVALAYLFIGLVFGLVNALVRPIVSFLSLPVTCLTLGLFALIINAAMLALTAWLSGYTPVHLTIDAFFWTAVLGAIIISLVSAVVGWVVGSKKK